MAWHLGAEHTLWVIPMHTNHGEALAWLECRACRAELGAELRRAEVCKLGEVCRALADAQSSLLHSITLQ